MTAYNLREPILEICRRLGLDPNLVASMNLRPGIAIMAVYETDEGGNKFIGADGDPVIGLAEFKLERP